MNVYSVMVVHYIMKLTDTLCNIDIIVFNITTMLCNTRRCAAILLRYAIVLPHHYYTITTTRTFIARRIPIIIPQ